MTLDVDRLLPAVALTTGLQPVAKAIDTQLEQLTGERHAFMLFVFSAEVISSIGSVADREAAFDAITDYITKMRSKDALV
jgi:hypothetical protein